VHEGFDNLGPDEWKFMILLSWISDDDLPDLKGHRILEDMKERGRIYCEPFDMIFDSIPENTRFWHAGLSYWPTEAWDNKNATVTLVGDAAHPMTFRTSSAAIYCPSSCEGAPPTI
jgi:hypothetical protein